jgi:hypothetical protein
LSELNAVPADNVAPPDERHLLRTVTRKWQRKPAANVHGICQGEQGKREWRAYHKEHDKSVPGWKYPLGTRPGEYTRRGPIDLGIEFVENLIATSRKCVAKRA